MSTTTALPGAACRKSSIAESVGVPGMLRSRRVGLVVLGALNRQRTLPRLRAVAAGGQSPGRTARVLRRTITGEIALLVAVLTVSGALVSYAPPAAQSNSTPRAVEREASGTMDDLHVEVGPGRTGPNRIDIYAFRQSDGLADKDLRAVRIIATPPGRARPVALISRAVSPGHFTVSAAAFTTPGAWTLELTGRSEQMPGMPPEHAVVHVPID